MKPRCSLFLATTLDGYISRPDGRIDWLDDANRRIPPGEDCGTADFLATVDAVVMGRGTFELLLGDGVWPYGSRPVRVMSRRRVSSGSSHAMISWGLSQQRRSKSI